MKEDLILKVGIITHYYNSYNYGGNLQAYALCKAIQKMGYDVSQIAYDRKGEGPFWENQKKSYLRVIKRLLKSSFVAFKHIELLYPPKYRVNRLQKRRKQAVLHFNRNFIPHSSTVYIAQDIKTSTNEFDVFITGSDQVWHPAAVCEAYLLDFVDGDKYSKFSYAASIATDYLTDLQQQRYRESMLDYQGISVREESAVDILQEIYPKKIVMTLDPTLLLSKEDWEKIIDKHPVKGSYVFCYFLGDDRRARKIVSEFAYKRGLKIVTLPHLLGTYRDCDVKFGHEHLYDVSPGMLLSLIKDAEYIFTDSFHATVFSLIFKKQHYVFHRKESKSMAVRIYSLVKLFETENYFCDQERKATLEYIEQLSPINYDKVFDEYEKMRSHSICFLSNQLEIAKNKLRTTRNE